MNFRPASRSSAPAPSPTRAACTPTPSPRNTASYEHIDPAPVGNERRILVSELSGQSTILAKTTKYAVDPRQGR